MNNSINLLYFGSDYKVGLTTALSEQILGLNKMPGLKLTCVSSENEMEPGLHEKIRINNVNMNIIPNLDSHTNFFPLATSISHIIEKENISHINVHNNWQLALVTYIKYKYIIPKKFKIIYTIHGYRHNSFLKSILAIIIIGLALLLFADRVISMSSYVSRRFWFIKYKTDIVFYIMSKPEFNKPENHIFASPLNMVFPAQFRYGKNQQILIKAVAKYIKRTNDHSVKLYLPGSGPLLKKCINLTNRLNLEKNIIFPGKLPHNEVIDLYEKCNIALVSSNVETYGRCIAEPYTLGRCVITKKTGVAIDIIENTKTGYLFTSTNDLVNILIYLYNNPTQIIYVANNAFKTKSIFSTKNVLDSYYNSIFKA